MKPKKLSFFCKSNEETHVLSAGNLYRIIADGKRTETSPANKLPKRFF